MTHFLRNDYLLKSRRPRHRAHALSDHYDPIWNGLVSGHQSRNLRAIGSRLVRPYFEYVPYQSRSGEAWFAVVLVLSDAILPVGDFRDGR